jgi:hypothetical protein
MKHRKRERKKETEREVERKEEMERGEGEVSNKLSCTVKYSI